MSLLAGCGSRSVNAEESCRNGHAEGCRLAGMALKKQHEMTRAVPLLQKACDGADSIACTELAELAVDGDGGLVVETSLWQALEQRACDFGSGRACKRLGLQLKFGTTTAIPRYDMPDWKPTPAMFARSAALLTRAVTLLQTSCDARDALSCEELGDLYKDGLSTPDFERAVALYERSCMLGGPTTCLGLRWAVLSSDAGRFTAEKAFSLLESACSKKDWRSCFSLADALNAGTLKAGTSLIGPVPVDQPRARRLRDEARRMAEADCRTTDDDACRTVANDATDGDKTRWFQLGCDRGSIDMCVLVGDVNRVGHNTGRGQDLGKAKEAYDRAAALARGRCRAGDVGACNRNLLPLINDHGIALAAGDLEAFWAACQATHDCESLAVLYSSGRVVPQDMEKAKELHRLACAPKEFYSWSDYARSCASSAPADSSLPYPSGIDQTGVQVEKPL